MDINMKRFKKLISLTVILGLLVTLFAGCGGQQSAPAPSGGNESKTEEPKKEESQKQVTLKIANYYAETHPQNIALKEVFKPMIEKESNGTIKVEIYPNNQLGAEKEFIEGTKMGTIEMNLMGVLLSEQFPKLKVMEFPFLFDSPEQGYKILSDEKISAEVTEGLSTVGLKVLGYSVNGVRAVSNSKHPINSVEDCKGIKLRVPQVKQHIEMAKALGFNAVTMPISEIFTALQQKVVDGQENPPTTVLASGWYEAQKYIALTNHMIAYNAVTVNEKFFNSLSKEQQDVVQKAVTAFTEKELELYNDAAQKDIETLKTKGIEFTTPDLKPFKEIVVANAYDKVLADTPEVKELIEKIWELQKTIK
ncbi:TRAP transporter substrate-binding protein [Petroclostridium sp. X23]|uniref:TRAP transporter substrate-binding protein n=1 Tax=Petroclostridium sp. X23 TaxID=3045146 RepID=UPI0024AC8A4C|nr:TRAP transporter substrate-binding protein [Petroclostridium sp. X23]WHH57686.1 TRAP transporter substrate-binding protein [Petroclostridium sp. X23]